MELKLASPFGAQRNIANVLHGDVVVGQMHVKRRSGWIGGRTYRFFPNEQGKSFGLKHKSDHEIKTLLTLAAASVK